MALSLNLVDKGNLARIETVLLFGDSRGVKWHVRALGISVVSTFRQLTHDICRCAI
jgi:hypothetical protein